MTIKYHSLKITVWSTLSDVHSGRYVWWIMIQIVEPWHSVYSEPLRADAYLRTGKSDFTPQFVSAKLNDEELALSSKPAFKSYISFHHYRETKNLNQRLIIYKTHLSVFDQTFFF
jgi:hypothetical protein